MSKRVAMLKRNRRSMMGSTRYEGRGKSTSSVLFTSGQSEDHPVYLVRYIYISNCLYMCGSINKSIR